MSAVSDETGGIPTKPKLRKVHLTEAQWKTARNQYEAEPCKDARSVERIMVQFGVSERTVRKKIADQKWRKGEAIADQAVEKLHQLVEAKLEPKADAIVERLSSKVEADMAPWFERNKRKHTKTAHRIVKARQRMIQTIVDGMEAITPKDAAYIAKADDTYDNMGRRTLGMSEGSGIGGSLSVQVLTNQAAVSITSTPGQSSP